MSTASSAPLARRALPGRALTRRAFADARVRTLSFAALFFLFSYLQPVAYRKGYPTLRTRVGFARSFGHNDAVRLFYGQPHNLLTVGGYAAWRVGGTLAILAAVFGLLAAVRALRAEEDAGRLELVLSSPLGRRTAFGASLTAIGAEVCLLWVAETLGLTAGGLPVGDSALLALATASVIPVSAGVGALACQLAPSRRVALELGGAAIALLFLVRVVADTASGAGWLRWLTPLGWAENLRPFTGAQPLVLALPVLAAVSLSALAGRIALGRDLGRGLLAARDAARANLRLLSSPAAHALREERTTLIAWSLGVGAFALVTGLLAKGSSSAGISAQVSHELGRLGSGSLVTPSGYLGFTFIFFVLALSLFGCAQISAARREEAEGQLETLLSLPVGRRRWLLGRLTLAVGAATGLALLAGLATWIGAALGGVSVSLPRTLEAGLNCLPAALSFLGIGALAYAALPRAAVGVSYGLVLGAFLWNLVSALLAAPGWLVKLSPFAHVALVPAEPLRTGAAALMVLIGLGCAAVATTILERRDLTTG